MTSAAASQQYFCVRVSDCLAPPSSAHRQMPHRQLASNKPHRRSPRIRPRQIRIFHQHLYRGCDIYSLTLYDGKGGQTRLGGCATLHDAKIAAARLSEKLRAPWRGRYSGRHQQRRKRAEYQERQRRVVARQKRLADDSGQS
jgi:hypothetical protein